MVLSSTAWLTTGWVDGNAISEATCRGNIDPWFRFLFVCPFYVRIDRQGSRIYLLSSGYQSSNLVFERSKRQARPKQFPVMILISGIGYVVTYFSSLHFKESQVASALGAFAIGVCGHVYSRLYHPNQATNLVSMDCMNLIDPY